VDSPRQQLGAPGPGTDPSALRLITVAVLAGLVISGAVVISRHGQAPGGTGATGQQGAQALTRRSLLAPLSLMPASRAGLVHRSARPLAGSPADRSALRLLSQAAVASRQEAYTGLEVVDGWAQAGSVTSVVRVWHPPGGMTLTQAVAPVPGWSGEVPHILLPAASLGGQAMVGTAMLGMSQRLVSLLAANYRVMAVGVGQVAGRRARIVAARWRDGKLAARFWLDLATALPLRRQTFDATGRVVSDASFAQVTLGPAAPVRPPATPARPWGDHLASAQLTALRARGWPLPGPLPGNLALLDARQEGTGDGRIIDLDYSDGLCLVSVFLERGHLPAQMTGWSEVVLHGRHVYADDSSGQGIAWSARGFVYTVVAAAPAQTVARVVAALPYGSSPGLLARLSRGLHRLWSWLSP
jgi:sigma-E factor negative regulatory protein RseB